MTRPSVSFRRTTTTDCETGEVTEDAVAARMGDRVIATLKKVLLDRDKFRWFAEWAAHSVLQSDIEQVLAKLVELNESERTSNAGK